MDLSTSIQIPKPGDFATFQRKCRVLFEAELGDPHVTEFGTSGQGQTGIDLLGVRRKLGLDHWVGVHCKLTIKAEKLKTGTVRKEATAALEIKPALKELIIATTAANDVAMDKEAAQFSDEQAKLGRDFRVVVWGWDTLQAKILQHPEALDAFMPGASASRQLLEGQDRIEEQVTITNAQISRFHEDISEIKVLVTRSVSAAGTDSSGFDQRFTSHLDQQIDIFRDLLNKGKPQREAAFEHIKAAYASGVVLDTYTAWLAVTLELVPVLKGLFARIAISQSVIDELIAWRQQYEVYGDEPIRTIGYRDGQYFREELPPEQAADAVRSIQSAVDLLRSIFEIVPAAAPAMPDEFERKLHSLGGSEMFHPVYAAKNEGLLLLSEDMLMRALAYETASVNGVWFQAVLMIAYDRKLLSFNDYAQAVLQLALRGHSHIALEVPTLNEILLKDDSAGLLRFEGALKFIGNENADVRSHWEVGWGFVQNVWNLDVPYLKRAAASGLMLRRLAALLHRHGLMHRAFSRLLRLRHAPELGTYLKGWCQGHFIFAPPPQAGRRSQPKASRHRHRA